VIVDSIVSPEIRALVADEAIGIEVERFLSGPAGKALIERLEVERASALEALTSVDPENARAVRSAQNDVALIDMVQQYLADLHATARQATERLFQIDQTD
jgi:hypothetical protein